MKFPKFDITERHLGRVVRDNNVTLKATHLRHEPILRFGKPIDINASIKKFYEEIQKYNLNDIICIDETSIKSLQKRNRCYSKIGKRCTIKTHSQEVFKKYTAIFAISTNGVLGWNLYEKGGITADRLCAFLETHITSRFKNKLVILDNAISHRNDQIKELVNTQNHLLYSVPYQHFTNSIENYFSMLKSKLQKLNGLKYDELKGNIEKVVKEISLDKYQHIFKGTYNRNPIFVKSKTRKRILKHYKDYKIGVLNV